MLLGFVYFLLISVLSGGVGDWKANLGRILIGIFTWYLASNSMALGSSSITSGGKLILNQAFPRALLPLSSVISAVLMYLPTIPVYLVYYLFASKFDTYEPTATGEPVAHHLPGLDNPALLWLPVAHRDPHGRVLRPRDDLRDDDGVLPRHEQVPRATSCGSGCTSPRCCTTSPSSTTTSGCST